MINAFSSSFLQLLLDVGFPGDFNTVNYKYICEQEKASQPSGLSKL